MQLELLMLIYYAKLLFCAKRKKNVEQLNDIIFNWKYWPLSIAVTHFYQVNTALIKETVLLANKLYTFIKQMMLQLIILRFNQEKKSFYKGSCTAV